ncbi:MAG: RHS repeat-associated core domain-containing protein [Candidatus Omnitrophica bacterium]|nr:RHS repeat-associated core domain-containing protein [Candidatus Omnitrophota bacterium]
MLTTINYTYGSGGGLLREREVVGGIKTRFHWEGLNLYMEEEWSGSAWVPKRTYINQPTALGGALARFDLGTSNTLDTSDSGWFYHYDEAGNVILITDKNGGLIKHFEQDAWGNDLNGTFATAQNIRQHQTGKYLDETTGLYFFGARWYDPAIGRFISVSPLSPLGEEEYVYCSENPVNIADVDGVWGIQIGEWNFGLGDPTFLFDRYSWKDFRKSLASTIDGIIPLFDPFEKYYSDECGNIEPFYKLSRHIAGFSRDIGSIAFIPNLSNWIRHPILYEIGSKTISAELYAKIAHLDAVEKGRWLFENVYKGNTRKALFSRSAWDQFGKTIGTGGTPGARLFLLGVFSALDYWTRR